MTFAQIDGYAVARRLGYVSGIASQQPNRLRATFRSIGALIGLSRDELLTDAEILRTQAIAILCERAGALGATAVLNTQFHVSEGDDGKCTVVAFGEAVILIAAAQRSA